VEIHKPKPWHGFREFLKEYLIIVVGVLTALAAEAVVEQLHWRHETAVAREAVAFDLRRALGWSGGQDAQTPCVAARLEELADILDKARLTKTLPALGTSPPPGQASWNMRSWSALVAGQTLAHMPNREQTLLAGIANRLDYLYRERDESGVEWATLSNMFGPARSVSDAELAQLDASLQKVVLHQAHLQAGAEQLPTFILQTGLLTEKQFSQAWNEGVAAGPRSPICGGFGPPEPRRVAIAHTFRPVVSKPGSVPLDTLGVSGAVSTER
jgi:hypothetical protein